MGDGMRHDNALSEQMWGEAGQCFIGITWGVRHENLVYLLCLIVF